MTIDLLLTVSADLVEIGTSQHKLSFSRKHPFAKVFPSPTHHMPVYLYRDRPAPMQVTSSVRINDTWQPLLDAPSPVVAGEQFDFRPDECGVIDQSADRVAVLFTGKHPHEEYRWEVLVECRAGSRLIHVVATCFLTSPLTVGDPQPAAMLWSESWKPSVVLNQGPGNIYTGPDTNGWGNAFPTAYGWGGGVEVGFFAQMSQLTWMSPSRFNKAYRVQVAEKDGRAGIGLMAHHVTRNPIPAGKHVVADYFLYAGQKKEKPTRLEALNRLVDIFADCHPPDAELPVNHAGGPTTWRHFSRGVIRNLLVKDCDGNPGACWDHIPIDPPWNDGLTPPVRQFRIYPDYALQSGSWPATNRKRATSLWDFSTCFNFVAPWIGIERMNPDPAWREALADSERGMPMFYDPEAKMVLRSVKHPPFDMPWQYLTFYYEMLKVHDMLAPEHFNPAIGGSVLLGLEGLIEMAHNEDYVWSQFSRPYEKEGAINQDIKSMGRVREPWQNGSYAWVMARAHQMTGEEKYLAEAKRSLDALLGGAMQFSVVNEHYEAHYHDPVDFPITEIFGNGFGIAGAQRVFELTRDAKYQQYSRDFFNSLARVAFWYESALDCDPRDQILQNLGLFQAFHSYAGAAPWETIEAFLPMTAMLRADNPLAPIGLMMRMFNTMRINAFFFFPPTFYGPAITSRELLESSADYLSIENFYMPERGGDHGGMGRCIYMTQIALWNDLLFETFATCSNPRIMVLNLDVLTAFHEAAMGIEQNFYVFNPRDAAVEARLQFPHLPPGDYRVYVHPAGPDNRDNEKSAKQLQEGLTIPLGPLSHAKVRIVHTDHERIRSRLSAIRTAQDRLCHAYQTWRAAQQSGANEARLAAARQHFSKAQSSYTQSRYDAAANDAAAVIAALRS